MNWISLICLFLIAICIAAPVSAFVDRNGVTSVAQFRDNVPASYLAKAGVTDAAGQVMWRQFAHLDEHGRNDPARRITVWLDSFLPKN
ncbi:MAG: hypothetical protein Q8S57_05720 [Methanoregula sp.]|nr:hypothetical protein [Methanoregula sp.]